MTLYIKYRPKNMRTESTRPPDFASPPTAIKAPGMANALFWLDETKSLILVVYSSCFCSSSESILFTENLFVYNSSRFK